MQTYILLMKLTEQGIKDIKNAPKRMELAVQALEAMGGKMIGIYSVNVRTTTLKAFTREEFSAIVQKMP